MSWPYYVPRRFVIAMLSVSVLQLCSLERNRMKRALAVLLILVVYCPGVLSNTTRKQQSIIAQWTAKSICKMGVNEFYSIDEDKIAALFEEQTSMKYTDIPMEPSDSERNRITSQLTGYILSVCPDQMEIYKNR